MRPASILKQLEVQRSKVCQAKHPGAGRSMINLNPRSKRLKIMSTLVNIRIHMSHPLLTQQWRLAMARHTPIPRIQQARKSFAFLLSNVTRLRRGTGLGKAVFVNLKHFRKTEKREMEERGKHEEREDRAGDKRDKRAQREKRKKSNRH